MGSPYRFFMLLFAGLAVLGCGQEGLVEDAGTDGSPDAELSSGIIFADDAPEFQLKPNDEAILFSINDSLLDRKTELPLTDEQLAAISFELRGANAQFFTLEKTAVDGDNGQGQGEQWWVFFNKDYQYFYDEVQTQCVFGRCNATLVARTTAGNEAISRIDIQLLTQDSFALVNGNSFDDISQNLSNQTNYRIETYASALEGSENTFYLLPNYVVQGKRLPSASNIGEDLQYDLNGDGVVDNYERAIAQNQLIDDFWLSAILSSKQMRQAKYIMLTEDGQLDERFSLGFEPVAPWFAELDKGLLERFNVFNRSHFFYQRYDSVKSVQQDGLWPVIYFNAPAIGEDQREELMCNRGLGNAVISTPYYQSTETILFNMVAIPPDETADWLYFNVSIRLLGSESVDYQYFADDQECSSTDQYAKPSWQLLVPSQESEP